MNDAIENLVRMTIVAASVQLQETDADVIDTMTDDWFGLIDLTDRVITDAGFGWEDWDTRH